MQLLNGDMHHSCNIQFAIDIIGENFILVDSDAPLIRKVDFFNSHLVTVCDIEQCNIEYTPNCLIFPKHLYRFVPYIQYLNVKLMKDNGISYWSDEAAFQNLDCAFFTRQDYGTGFYCPTGSLLFKKVMSGKFEFTRINH